MAEHPSLTPAEIVDRLQVERERLLTAVGRATGPTADGWTPAEHLAHIVAWQRRLLTWFADDAADRAVERPETGWTFGEIDVLNARDRDASRGISLEVARAAFEEGHAEVIALVGRLTAADLNAPERYAWLGYAAADAIAGNSFGHYGEHAEWLGG